MSKSTIARRLTKPAKAKDVLYAVVVLPLGIAAVVNSYNGVIEFIATH